MSARIKRLREQSEQVIDDSMKIYKDNLLTRKEVSILI